MDAVPGTANGQHTNWQKVTPNSMSRHLILLTMCIYAYVACEQLCKKNVPGFITWGSYALANIGLWMMAK